MWHKDDEILHSLCYICFSVLWFQNVWNSSGQTFLWCWGSFRVHVSRSAKSSSWKKTWVKKSRMMYVHFSFDTGGGGGSCITVQHFLFHLCISVNILVLWDSSTKRKESFFPPGGAVYQVWDACSAEFHHQAEGGGGQRGAETPEEVAETLNFLFSFFQLISYCRPHIF